MQIVKNIKYSFAGVLLLFTFACQAQMFMFAHVTDTHVGSGTGADDLRITVSDINQQRGLAFVVVTGDITEFGADKELKLARQILDSLQVPWYVIPGNHDANWSESGGNTFRSVFGAETFAFEQHGYRFAGTNSGPNMRMSPGQIPRENLVWLDSLFSAGADAEKPLIYINHYPQDSSLNNWYEAIDRIKTQNIQLLICGHGHHNEETSYEGIPSIMGRSNLRANDSVGGYNLVTIDDGVLTYRERNPGIGTKEPWATIPLQNHHFNQGKRTWPRPDFQVNNRYSKVKPAWTYQDNSDVGAGMAVYKNSIIAVNTAGQIYALNSRTGKKIWTYQTGGKIYSTPAVWKKYVVVGSADNNVYCLGAGTGRLLWKYAASNPVLGSAIIQDGIAYIGASDQEFRAIDVKSGELKWSFKGVKGHITDKPLYYNRTIYFGSWGNGFYALDPENGGLKWSWDNGQSNRMFSAASCYPVGASGRIFVVAPDRYMTALNASSGELIWRKQMAGIRVRESMGLSVDSSLVYVKTMDGELLGVSTTADDMQIAWRSALRLPYELDPSAIVALGEEIFVPSHSGLISTVNAADGHVSWQYKTSNAMVNPVLPLKKRRVAVSTMDGKVVCLDYKDAN